MFCPSILKLERFKEFPRQFFDNFTIGVKGKVAFPNFVKVFMAILENQKGRKLKHHLNCTVHVS